MLVLTRKKGESLYIGDNIVVSVVSIEGARVRIGITAPKNVIIYRDDIKSIIKKSDKQVKEKKERKEGGIL